jgi:hypothetical protein
MASECVCLQCKAVWAGDEAVTCPRCGGTSEDVAVIEVAE